MSATPKHPLAYKWRGLHPEIVRRCDSHDLLLAALRLALDIIENDDGCGHGIEPIHAAIAKATEQS